ncbi:hypothetical protein [Caproiciproducens faecalis]|uniref:Uncharacterized protein n=1 Tax=Caproiciproducens faecalis TaxID=2820301 RepID=A0ABS7DM18_9FIRM|nr:hypothetical protein [Caproiciproducens faecalis]MBW7572347.1 hypothetical protein [Caproiciproducens faecalis]
MSELTKIQERNDRFRESLKASVEHFRKGEDQAGLDEFLNSMDDLEGILQYYQCTGEPEMELDKMLAVLEKLPVYLNHQDVAGLADTLEFTLYPLSENWMKGVTENGGSPSESNPSSI